MRAQRRLAFERDDERIGHLAFAQVHERVLAGARAKVELVVDRLKCDAEMKAVALEGELAGGTELGDARACDHRPAEQCGGLAFDDAEVIIAIGDELAAALELQRLGEDHLVDHGEHAIEQAGHAGGCDPAQRRHEQPVTGEDRCGVAVDDTRGRLAAAALGEIDDVVVQ